MGRYLFILLLISLVFYSCQSNQCVITSVIPKNDNSVIIKKIDKCRGKTISEEQNIKDQNGSLIQTGYYRQYYKNGKLKEMGFLNKGIPDSIYIKYYPNGKKKIVYYRWRGQASGGQYTYYPNGNIKSMIFCKNDSTALFATFFNPSGIVKKVQGSAIHLVIQPGCQNLKVGQTFGIVNVICLFHNTHGIMNIKLRKNNKIIWDTTMTRFRYLGREPYYLFLGKMRTSGVYKYCAKAEIISDTKSMLIKKDSEMVVINVGIPH